MQRTVLLIMVHPFMKRHRNWILAVSLDSSCIGPLQSLSIPYTHDNSEKKSMTNLRPFWYYSVYKTPLRVRSGEVALNCPVMCNTPQPRTLNPKPIPQRRILPDSILRTRNLGGYMGSPPGDGLHALKIDYKAMGET